MLYCKLLRYKSIYYTLIRYGVFGFSCFPFLSRFCYPYIAMFSYINSGVYIKFEIHFFDPPPLSWLIFFPKIKLSNFVHLRSIGEKICILVPIGGKICIFLPFFIPFQYFFSPNMLLIHIFWVKQKNKHPC